MVSDRYGAILEPKTAKTHRLSGFWRNVLPERLYVNFDLWADDPELLHTGRVGFDRIKKETVAQDTPGIARLAKEQTA